MQRKKWKRKISAFLAVALLLNSSGIMSFSYAAEFVQSATGSEAIPASGYREAGTPGEAGKPGKATDSNGGKLPSGPMEKNPFLTASPSEAVFGDVLTVHVTAAADSDLEESILYLSSEMNHAKLTEDIIFDEQGTAIIFDQNEEPLELHRMIEKNQEKEVYWLTLNKGEAVEFDLSYISCQSWEETETATPFNAVLKSGIDLNTASVVLRAGLGDTRDAAKEDVADLDVEPVVLTWEPGEVWNSTSSGTLDIVWLPGTNSVIEGDNLDVTAPMNTKQTVFLQIHFSGGGDKEIQAGEVEIRIPAHIFLLRNGITAADTVSVPLSEKGNPTGDTGFWYEIDKKETSENWDDEIVISNYKTIGGATYFQCDLKFEFLPSNVADRYEKEIQATFRMPGQDGNPVTVPSDSVLVVRNHTDSKILYFTNSVYESYESWQNKWGPEPADSKDYFYVWWRARATFGREITQPFIFTVSSENNNSGILVGGSKYISQPIKAWAEDGKLSMKEDFIPPNPTGGSSYSDFSFLIKYPRTLLEILPEGGSLALVNNVACTLDGWDGAYDEKEATGRYIYQPPKYPNRTYKGSKNSYGIGTGTGKVNVLEAGHSADQEYELRPVILHYDENRVPGCKVEIIDETGKIGYGGWDGIASAEMLTPVIDYRFSHINLVYHKEQDIIEEDGEYIQQEVSADEYDPISLYIKTLDSPNEWVLYGEFNQESSHSTTFTYEATGNVENRADFPENITAFKLGYEVTHAYSESHFLVGVSYNPSERINGFCKDKNWVDVYNSAQFTVTDLNGNIIAKMDDAADFRLSRLKPITKSSKLCEKIINDIENSRVITKWVCSVYDRVGDAGFSDYSNILNPYTSGYFYDLLPAGTTVENLKVSPVLKNSKTNIDWKAEYIENWKDSGRTMMKVYITSENKTPYTDTDCGYLITYDLISTWANIRDNGTELKNYAAYQSACGDLANGYPDAQPESEVNKDSVWKYFDDLDEDGNPDPNIKTTTYMSGSYTITEPTAAEAGFKKSVKAEGKGDYSLEALTDLNQDYSYRLRYETQENNKSSNLIFYDVLEAAYPSNEYWQGSLLGVSTANATNKGAEVKVYYSTTPGIKPYDKTGILAEGDLDDTTYWSLSPPTDLSEVTALAFDLRKNTLGEDFVLSNGASTYVEIYMKAALKDETILDSASTPNIKTYNESACQTTTIPIGGGSSTAIESAPVTTVELRQNTSLKVSKVWSDSDSVDHSADSVTVHLLADGEKTGNTLVLKESNGWTGTFEDLDAKHENNTKIVYTVEEDAVANYIAGYAPSASEEDSIVITNTYSPPKYDLIIHKTNVEGTKSLSGVEFALYQASVDTEGNWTKTDPDMAFFQGTTGADGRLTLKDIISGNYLLYETKAANGYHLPQEPWRITLDLDGNFTVMDSTGTEMTKVGDVYQITNETDALLPDTGGIGTMIFYILGELMMLGAVVLLRIRKRISCRAGKKT